MTFTYMRKKKLTGGAFAAALVLTGGMLTACGGDDADAADAAGTTDAAAAAAGLEGSEVLQAMQVKAEEYGYPDCMMAPASAEDLTTVRLSCTEAELPQISIFDRADRESGSELVEAELDKVMKAHDGTEGGLSREELGSNYRALEGDEVVGWCQDFRDGCDEVAEALGLEATLPEGALTGEELEKKRKEDRERDAREYEEQRKREEEEKKRELQTYSGWDNLDEAREQLEAWDISCREEPAAEGEVAWCNLSSMLVTFGMSVDDLEKKDVFKEVGRDEMTSVSDGDWTVICAPGATDKCELVAEKAGKSVKDGV
ncbi:hypothetical protein [Corynebacterium sp.]|uniref:hypothetical protein n=1 Tax=Corynebacterium sp. TaxID=1720 RepID=UPI0025BB6BC7|nr:hypothetical protein [Corynebacterium sp.]